MSPRLAALAAATASPASSASRRAPNTSGTHCASRPSWNRFALLSLPAVAPARVRCAEPDAPSVGSSAAAATSRRARAWRSAAWALATLVLERQARPTRSANSGSSKRCHQAVSESAVTASAPAPAASAADHPEGTSMTARSAPEVEVAGAHAAQPDTVTNTASRTGVQPIRRRLSPAWRVGSLELGGYCTCMPQSDGPPTARLFCSARCAGSAGIDPPGTRPRGWLRNWQPYPGVQRA